MKVYTGAVLGLLDVSRTSVRESHNNEMQLPSTVLSLALVSSIFANVRSTKGKAYTRLQKPINWNLSYYSEPWRPCKSMRKLDPVEQFRAHGVAVDVFRKCGSSIIVPCAIRYNFPAYGGKSVCPYGIPCLSYAIFSVLWLRNLMNCHHQPESFLFYRNLQGNGYDLSRYDRRSYVHE